MRFTRCGDNTIGRFSALPTSCRMNMLFTWSGNEALRLVSRSGLLYDTRTLDFDPSMTGSQLEGAYVGTN